jgi:hypothetical protein
METIEAKHGDKTIRLTIGFDAQLEKGRITPKHAKDKGWVWVQGNSAHGLKSSRESFHFNSRESILAAIDKALKEYGIVLHSKQGDASQTETGV